MNIIIKKILLVFFSCIFALSNANSIETKAISAHVEDITTNTVLFEKKSDVPYGPASMSKLLIIYLAFERLQNGSISLQDEFVVSKKAWKFGGSKMFVNIGDKVTVEDLLKGIIVQSGNDACIVLAEGLSGSEENMVEEMNERKDEFGLSNSNFTNVTGWPNKDHYMSARDIVQIAKILIINFPEYYSLFSMKEFTYNDIKQYNRNKLIDDNYDGLKTGRTNQTGFGLVASAQRKDRRIISVVNGLNSDQERIKETKKLVEWAFRDFKKLNLYTAEQTIVETKVWLGNTSYVSLAADKDIKVTIPKRDINKLQIKAKYKSPIPAPIKKGDKLGELVISTGDNEISYPLVAGNDVKTINKFLRSFSIINYLLFGVGSPEK